MKESPTDQRHMSYHIGSEGKCRYSTIEPICCLASVRKELAAAINGVCETLALPKSPSICKLALQRALKAHLLYKRAKAYCVGNPSAKLMARLCFE